MEFAKIVDELGELTAHSGALSADSFLDCDHVLRTDEVTRRSRGDTRGELAVAALMAVTDGVAAIEDDTTKAVGEAAFRLSSKYYGKMMKARVEILRQEVPGFERETYKYHRRLGLRYLADYLTRQVAEVPHWRTGLVESHFPLGLRLDSEYVVPVGRLFDAIGDVGFSAIATSFVGRLNDRLAAEGVEIRGKREKKDVDWLATDDLLYLPLVTYNYELRRFLETAEGLLQQRFTTEQRKQIQAQLRELAMVDKSYEDMLCRWHEARWAYLETSDRVFAEEWLPDPVEPELDDDARKFYETEWSPWLREQIPRYATTRDTELDLIPIRALELFRAMVVNLGAHVDLQDVYPRTRGKIYHYYKDLKITVNGEAPDTRFHYHLGIHPLFREFYSVDTDGIDRIRPHWPSVIVQPPDMVTD